MARLVITLALAWTLGGLTATAQEPVTNEDGYAKAMRAIAAAFGGINKMVKSGAMDDARVQAERLKGAMRSTEPFWQGRKAGTDPRMLTEAAVVKIEALEKALTGMPTNTASSGQMTAVQTAVAGVASTCGGCHDKYREQDPETKAFKFKPGVL